MKPLVAWLAAVLTGLLAALSFVVRLPESPLISLIGFTIGWSAYALVGLLIAVRRPNHPVGWLFLTLALASQASVVGEEGAPTLQGGSFQLVVLALVGNLWVVAFTLVARLLAVFPTGRLPSPRWQPLTILSVLVVAVGLPTAGHEVSMTPLSILLGPSATAVALSEVGQSVSGFGILALTVLSVAAMGLRMARARGIERQQLKWFAYSAFLLVTAFVVTSFAYFTPELRALDPDAPVPPAMFAGIPFTLALVAIPIAAGIAILRHRLFDIDLVINRTLVYGALTVSLGAVYFGLVIGLQGLLSGFAGGGSLAVAASTLAVAALFQPIRRRIQLVVDRRFYRSRYDAQRTLEAFTARLRHEVDLLRLTDELASSVEQSLQPASVSVWLRAPESAR